MPEANEMVVGMMAVIAQAERKMISARTKAALAEAKTRIVVTGQKKCPDVKRLGSPLGVPPMVTQEQRQKGADAKARLSREFAERLRPTFAVLEDLSANAAAHELTRRGVSTAQGGKWSAGKVIAIRRRLEAVS
jgi:DNA invertase Pin-like site-specific DNA recombinase